MGTDYTRERIGQRIEEKNKQQAKKFELQKTYKSAEKEVADLNRKLANIKQYLGQEQTPERAENKKPEQSL